MMHHALRLARRDVRGGWREARAALLGLGVGVAGIVTVAALGDGLQEGLAEGGRVLLGGDVALRTVMAPLTAKQRAALADADRHSESLDLYGMAANGGMPTLVAVKAVDAAYPLYGAVELDPPGPLAQALAVIDGVPGVIVEPSLAERLDALPGTRFALGSAVVELRAVLVAEPDRASSPFLLAERLMIGGAGLDALGLVQPGSLVRYTTRVRLDPGLDVTAWVESLRRAVPDAPWQIATYDAANPRLERAFERLRTFFVLVGLGALIVGGVGIASAMRAYLGRKRPTIAILKAVGADGRFVSAVYALEVAGLVAPAVLGGVLAGLAGAVGLALVAGSLLPVEAAVGVHPGAAALGLAFGALVAVGAAIGPLGHAVATAPLTLLRESTSQRGAFRWRPILLHGLVAGATAGLALATSADQWLAGWVLGGVAATSALFVLIAYGVRRAALAARGHLGGTLRLAVAGLARPGAPTTAMVIALGLGLALLATVVLVEGNLRRALVEALPRAAPSFFVLDIQPEQVATFETTVAGIAGAEVIDLVPSLRGRIVRIGGKVADPERVDPSVRWAIEGDRGVTVSARPPEGAEVVAGAWWPEDYDGPPLVSLDSGIAQGLGVGVGDTLGLNILGRDIEVIIANLRRIEWETLGVNFTLILPPSTLAGAPFTHLATIRAAPDRQAALREALGRAVPNASVIAVAEVLGRIDAILGQVAVAIRIAAGIAVAIGVLVLAQAIGAARRSRLYDAVIAKVVGATRGQIMAIALIEHGLAGVAGGLGAALVGTAAAWAVTVHVLDLDFAFDLATTVFVTLGGAGIAAILGLVSTARMLGAGTAGALRATAA
ncbi:MAG: FtsX-like permease family protein [Alphaproteobacteria bacterium]